MEQGWSIKKLHRMIVLSNTYQQRSDMVSKSVAADPENRLLWRANRRRLDFESLRDAILVASGAIDRTLGGRPVSRAISYECHSLSRYFYYLKTCFGELSNL